MSKDPAILFYTADFLAGTITMTDEQVGKYIKLLCVQHQRHPKRLTKKDMLNICKTYDEEVFSKFLEKDDLFFNQRMEDEIVKRKNYSESRRKNRLSLKKNISKTYDGHMVIENENENKDGILRGGAGEKRIGDGRPKTQAEMIEILNHKKTTF